MTSNASSTENLQRLAERNLLKAEPAAAQEIAAFLAASARLLADARRQELADETRFTAVYSAAHLLALAALRLSDYRPAQGPGHRSIVFQTLPHTVGASPELWVPLSKMHDKRNALEYAADTAFSRTEVEQWVTIVSDLDRVVRGWLARHRPDLETG
jgi:hypothetical protein